MPRDNLYYLTIAAGLVPGVNVALWYLGWLFWSHVLFLDRTMESDWSVCRVVGVWYAWCACWLSWNVVLHARAIRLWICCRAMNQHQPMPSSWWRCQPACCCCSPSTRVSVTAVWRAASGCCTLWLFVLSVCLMAMPDARERMGGCGAAWQPAFHTCVLATLITTWALNWIELSMYATLMSELQPQPGCCPNGCLWAATFHLVGVWWVWDLHMEEVWRRLGFDVPDDEAQAEGDADAEADADAVAAGAAAGHAHPHRSLFVHYCEWTAFDQVHVRSIALPPPVLQV